MGEIEDAIQKASPYYEKKKSPETEHKLVYDSSTETLEPVYFWILDLMNNVGLKVEKLVDNFVSSPGSGHFAELGQRATIMQQQGSKILGDVNTVLRSVLNIIYDLKEFRMRLQSYDDLNSKDSNKSEAARLSLKQIWMDKVDMQKGNSSIKAMALGQAGFQTLIDAFLVAKNEKDVDKIDLNERVKRILKPRVQEFNIWIAESEKELRKRYNMEKTYLKSQVNSLKLYSRWAKPYLRAAQQLEMKEVGKEPALVKTFNTIILELTLFGKAKIDPPTDIGKITLKRNYYKCVIIEFKFRGIPQRVAQQSHYAFGGRAEVSFRGYALNDDELKKFEEELEKSDVNDTFKLIEGATSESLEQLQEEINFFLEEETKEKEKEKSSDTSNPFLALIGHYDKKETTKKKIDDKNKKIRPDDWIEKTHIRTKAITEAKQQAFDLFNIYKKGHGMANFDLNF